METKKYELVENDTIEVGGHILYRIKALKTFYNNKIIIHKDDFGGYIENEFNLSQNDTCWVFDNAKVYGNAYVSEDAKVFRNACISDNACIYGNACISGNAKVSEYAYVSGNAKVFGNAKVNGNARVFGDAKVYGDAIITEQGDYLCITDLTPKNTTITFFKIKSKEIFVNCDWFSGTLQEFEKKAIEIYGSDTKYIKGYLAMISMVKIHFSLVR